MSEPCEIALHAAAIRSLPSAAAVPFADPASPPMPAAAAAGGANPAASSAATTLSRVSDMFVPVSPSGTG